MKIEPAKPKTSNVVIYEFGCRIDRETEEAIQGQIVKSRRLYNDIVAIIRDKIQDMQAYVISKAGDEAQRLQAAIEQLNEQFAIAKAADNEPEMKRVAQVRREHWASLAKILKGVRSAEKKNIQTLFLAKIGRNSSCDTYQARCAAVTDGLGWATANAVLDAALQAFKKTFTTGQAPRFSIGALKEQDTLFLQFTKAGGVEATSLLEGKQSDLRLTPPEGGAGRRKYGQFMFRLGAAKNDQYATGTFLYHRAIPEGANVSQAKLVRRRIGKDIRYALQLTVSLPAPLCIETGKRKPLVAVHFGWAYDSSGRRVAGIADAADPGAVRVLQLPPAIEAKLERSANLQAQRDAARDDIAPRVKADLKVPDEADPQLLEEWQAFKKLPVQYISANRLNRLIRTFRDGGITIPDWLEEWRKTDRLTWQSQTHLAKRARNGRKKFYQQVALELASQYQVIAIEPLDLSTAAKKVDEKTGEKTELSKKVRAGRVVAALYELESALRWAGEKHGCAVLDVQGKTASHCSICDSTIQADTEDLQIVRCDGCGAELDRKRNGAAMTWQAVNAAYETAVTDYWCKHSEAQAEAKAKNAEKKGKLIAARAANRAAKESEEAA